MLVNDILTELETVAHDFEYSHQVSDFIVKKFKAAEEQQTPDSKDPSQKKQLFWEYELFRFVTKTEFAKQDGQRRFFPLGSRTTAEGTEVEFPDIRDFTEESTQYFKQRVIQSQNKVLIARYADFLWEHFGFCIEYVDAAYNLRNYYPDFTAIDNEGTCWLLETKGMESAETAYKDTAATLWCENATKLTGKTWRYKKVPQSKFAELQPIRLLDLNVV